MARPESNTVSYFPHKIGDGKKIFSIEAKYGNDGYATWFKILEKLATTENHYLDLNDEIEVMYLSAKCRVSEDVLFSIINDLTRLGCFDKILWEKRYIWSQVFIDSIQDAYSRRNNKCMTYDGLCKHLLIKCTTETPKTPVLDDNNPQSKVKYSKVKEKRIAVASLSVPQEKEIFSSIKANFLKNYADTNGTEYYFQPKDGAKIYDIISKVVFKMKETKNEGELTQMEIINAVSIFLKAAYAIGDNWLKSNYNLSNIDNKFNDLYAQLKLKSNGKSITNNRPQSKYAS